MTAPILNLGDLHLDLSAPRFRDGGCRFTIAASSGGGKSTLATVIVEELHAIGQKVLIIDPDLGEHRALAHLPGVRVMDCEHFPGRDWIVEAVTAVTGGGLRVAGAGSTPAGGTGRSCAHTVGGTYHAPAARKGYHRK